MYNSKYILGEGKELIKALPKEEFGTVYMDLKYIKGQKYIILPILFIALDTKDIYNIISGICHIIEYLDDLNQTISYKDLNPNKIIITPNNKIFIVDIDMYKNDNMVNDKYKAINSIGKIMYFMATGKMPFTDLEPLVSENYGNNIDYNLKRIIQKCFEINISKRYVSIEELNREIIIELLKKSKQRETIDVSYLNNNIHNFTYTIYSFIFVINHIIIFIHINIYYKYFIIWSYYYLIRI
ncbi:serine/threonine protein kinase [Clostridium tetanomorphum DSM 665]|nr:serine/threonine protein kinase [Clostridium tetanomorphum DSM 665]